MKMKLELTERQVEILRDCLHEQIVTVYNQAHQTPLAAVSEVLRGVAEELEDIYELLKF